MANKKEQERVLTEAEQRRQEHFDTVCDELAVQGYKRTNLTISIFWANVAAIVGMIVLTLMCLFIFHVVHPEASIGLTIVELLIFIVAIVVLTVVHELIHGLTWSFFAPNGFKDIEFGIMMDSFTPYCTCATPLKKVPYILGALMPLIVLGIIPTIVAIAVGSSLLLYIGVLMVVAAAGDIMIVGKILTFRSEADELVIYDHPTEAGSVIFEK